MLISSSSFVLRRLPLVVLSTLSLRRQTSLVFRTKYTTYSLYTSVLSIPNPKSRTSPHRRCVFPLKNSQFPSTPKIKLPTTRVTSRTLSVLHVIASSISSPFSQVLPRLTIWISTVPCQVSFDLPPSVHHNPFRTPTTGLQSFSRKDFMFIRRRFYRHRIW